MKILLIITIAIIVILSDYFFLGIITPGYRPPPEVDGQYGILFKDKINQHSYVRQPPIGRRALRDQLYVFEMPKADIDEVLKLKDGEDKILNRRFEEVPSLMQDVRCKLAYIAQFLNKKGEKYESHNFSSSTMLYGKQAGLRQGEPFHFYILVDSSSTNLNNYIVVVDIPSNPYSKSILDSEFDKIPGSKETN